MNSRNPSLWFHANKTRRSAKLFLIGCVCFFPAVFIILYFILSVYP